MAQSEALTVGLVAFDRRVHLLEMTGQEASKTTLCRRNPKRQTPFGTRVITPELLKAMLGDPDSYCRLCVVQAAALAGYH